MPTNLSEKILLFLIKAGAYLLLFSPLVVVPSFFFPFISPKGFYIMALCQIIFGAWLVLTIFFPKYRPKFNLLVLGVALYLFILILSTLFSVSPSKSFYSNYERMTGLLFYLHLFFLFLVLGLVFRKKDWQRFFFFSLFVGFLVSFIFLLAFLIGEEKILFASNRGSTLGNSSFFATYLLFQIFFLLYLLFQAKSKKTIFLLVGLFLFFETVLYLSSGRASFLANLLGLFLLFLLYFGIFYKNPKIKILGKTALFVFLFLIFFGVVLLCLPGSFLQDELAYHSTKARPLVWQIAIKGFKERPIFGWGLQNFNFVFAKHFNPCFFLEECGGEIWFDKAHNIIFDHLIETGILGLLFYLLIYFFSLGILWERYSASQKNFWQAGIFSSLFLAYFLQNLTVFDTPISLLFFSFALAFLATPKEEKEEEKDRQRREKISKRYFYLWFVLVFFFVGLSLFEFVFLPTKTSFLYLYAKKIKDPQEQLLFWQKITRTTSFGQEQIRIYLARDYIEKYSPKNSFQKRDEFILRELEKTNPKDLKTVLLLSKIYLLLSGLDNQKIQKAKEYAWLATKISPKNQQGYWLLSKILLKEKNCQDSLKFAKYAYLLEPKLDISKIILLQVWSFCQKELSLEK